MLAIDRPATRANTAAAEADFENGIDDISSSVSTCQADRCFIFPLRSGVTDEPRFLWRTGGIAFRCHSSKAFASRLVRLLQPLDAAERKYL
jgi:hypothetical protein